MENMLTAKPEQCRLRISNEKNIVKRRRRQIEVKRAIEAESKGKRKTKRTISTK